MKSKLSKKYLTQLNSYPHIIQLCECNILHGITIVPLFLSMNQKELIDIDNQLKSIFILINNEFDFQNDIVDIDVSYIPLKRSFAIMAKLNYCKDYQIKMELNLP